MTDAIQFPALLDKITTLKDGSVRVGLETQELGDEEAAALLSMRNRMGWITFTSSRVDAVSVPDEMPPEFKDDKSPGQRLRAALFVWWNQAGRRGEFDSFYRAKMERFIDLVKERLT